MGEGSGLTTPTLGGAPGHRCSESLELGVTVAKVTQCVQLHSQPSEKPRARNPQQMRLWEAAVAGK